MKKLLLVIVVLVAGLAFLIGGCDTPATNPDSPSSVEQTSSPSVFQGKKDGGDLPMCCSGAISGIVWEDANCNGIQDPGEIPFPLVQITITDANGNLVMQGVSSWDGKYGWGTCQGTYTVTIVPPQGYQLSPASVPGSTPENDSNTNPSIVVIGCAIDSTIDFGLCRTPPPPSGKCGRTPGYWKTHPSKWPVRSITIGGVVYTKAEAIYYMQQPDGDKRYTMFRHLVAAKLNLIKGTNSSCIASTITQADQWMAAYAGSGLGNGTPVPGSDDAWRVGEPLAITLDMYNNGLLCIPHCE